MEELCPDVLFLNYTNPMAMQLQRDRAATQDRDRRPVPQRAGHGFAARRRTSASRTASSTTSRPASTTWRSISASKPTARTSTRVCAELAEPGGVPSDNRVRYERAASHFGYFVTESSEHFAEYVPWFIKRDRPDLIDRFNIPLDEYPRRCEEQIDGWEARRDAARGRRAARSQRAASSTRSHHPRIETGKTRVVYGNVANEGLIDNLPRGTTVEVPCVVDRSGLHPVHVGALPIQLAALIQTNVNVQTLTVEAALTGRRDHVVHAALLDPHTAAELDPDQIVALVDDLLAAHDDAVRFE